MSTGSPTRTAGGVLLILAAIAVVGIGAIFLPAGLSVDGRTPLGQTATWDLPAGDHAVYVTPGTGWASVECTGSTQEGQQIVLRPDMTQQDLYIPQRWDARGSFEVDAAGVVEVTCTGDAAGEFAVGAVVAFFHVAGAVVLAGLAVVLIAVGIPLRVSGGARRGGRMSGEAAA